MSMSGDVLSVASLSNVTVWRIVAFSKAIADRLSNNRSDLPQASLHDASARAFRLSRVQAVPHIVLITHGRALRLEMLITGLH